MTWTAQAVYVLGLVLGVVIRVRWGLPARRQGSIRHLPLRPLETICMGLWGVSQVTGLLVVVSSMLDWARYPLSAWARAVGIVVFAAAVLLLWRAHADLGNQWAPDLRLRPDHQLVTAGVYARIRHPLYAAHLLWGVGQSLLLGNWLAGPLALGGFAAFYALRVGREEAFLAAAFGQQWKQYRRRSGRILPPLTRR